MARILDCCRQVHSDLLPSLAHVAGVDDLRALCRKEGREGESGDRQVNRPRVAMGLEVCRALLEAPYQGVSGNDTMGAAPRSPASRCRK